MLEAQFPNALKNKELEDNAEYLAKQLLQHIYYLKRKERRELNLRGVLPQTNVCPTTRVFEDKKNKFGTHPERYAPDNLPEGETMDTQEQKKAWLRAAYRLVDIDWIRANKFVVIYIMVKVDKLGNVLL